eukprot:11182352-Lingulodinium_polyedra.AAC.1
MAPLSGALRIGRLMHHRDQLRCAPQQTDRAEAPTHDGERQHENASRPTPYLRSLSCSTARATPPGWPQTSLPAPHTPRA